MIILFSSKSSPYKENKKSNVRQTGSKRNMFTSYVIHKQRANFAKIFSKKKKNPNGLKTNLHLTSYLISFWEMGDN